MSNKQEWNDLVKMFNDSDMIIMEKDRQEEIGDKFSKLCELIDTHLEQSQVDILAPYIFDLTDLIFTQKKD